jgi:hypothetical protein
MRPVTPTGTTGRALDFPPPTVRDPADYGGGARLSLAITQTTLKPVQQKALVREWCALLPTLDKVRTLWFHTKVTQEMFEAASAMPKPGRAVHQMERHHLAGANRGSQAPGPTCI